MQIISKIGVIYSFVARLNNDPFGSKMNVLLDYRKGIFLLLRVLNDKEL